MQTNELLQELIETVKVGGNAGTFLGEAFISFYRGGENKVDLRDSCKLDQRNFQLFTEMLTLCRRPGWSDDELYGVEQQIKKLLQTTT